MPQLAQMRENSNYQSGSFGVVVPFAEIKNLLHKLPVTIAHI